MKNKIIKLILILVLGINLNLKGMDPESLVVIPKRPESTYCIFDIELTTDNHDLIKQIKGHFLGFEEVLETECLTDASPGIIGICLGLDELGRRCDKDASLAPQRGELVDEFSCWETDLSKKFPSSKATETAETKSNDMLKETKWARVSQVMRRESEKLNRLGLNTSKLEERILQVETRLAKLSMKPSGKE